MRTYRWSAGIALLAGSACISPAAAALAILAVAAFAAAALSEPKRHRYHSAPKPLIDYLNVRVAPIEPEDAIPAGYQGDGDEIPFAEIVNERN